VFSGPNTGIRFTTVDLLLSVCHQSPIETTGSHVSQLLSRLAFECDADITGFSDELSKPMTVTVLGMQTCGHAKVQTTCGDGSERSARTGDNSDRKRENSGSSGKRVNELSTD